MKPRLLIILNRLAIGGPAMNTLALADQLSEHYEILLLAGEAMPHEHSADHLLAHYTGFKVQIIRDFTRNILLWKDYRAYQKIKLVIRTFAPHIVHTHGSKPGVLGRWAAHRLHVPVIVHTYHGHVFHSYFPDWISRLILALERRLAHYTDIIIAINSQLQKDLTETYRIVDASRILLSPLGIDADFYKQSDALASRNKIRQALQLNKEEIAVVAIGRLVPVKQHRLMVQVAARLIQHQPSIPFRFFIVGDGPEREDLIRLAASYGLKTGVGHVVEPGTNLHFLLWRTDIPLLLSGMDILLHTSLNEGTPVSLLEALWMGIPIVSTPVGGIPELIHQSQAGITATDIPALADHLVELARQPEIRRKMGENGKVFMERSISVREQANTLKACIDQLGKA